MLKNRFDYTLNFTYSLHNYEGMLSELLKILPRNILHGIIFEQNAKYMHPSATAYNAEPDILTEANLEFDDNTMCLTACEGSGKNEMAYILYVYDLSEKKYELDNIRPGLDNSVELLFFTILRGPVEYYTAQSCKVCVYRDSDQSTDELTVHMNYYNCENMTEFERIISKEDLYEELNIKSNTI